MWSTNLVELKPKFSEMWSLKKDFWNVLPRRSMPMNRSINGSIHIISIKYFPSLVQNRPLINENHYSSSECHREAPSTGYACAVHGFLQGQWNFACTVTRQNWGPENKVKCITCKIRVRETKVYTIHQWAFLWKLAFDKFVLFWKHAPLASTMVSL